MPLSLAQMRRNYTLGGLQEAEAPLEPLSLFAQWLQQARETEREPVEANSMHLATVDATGRPHCRVLLLKGVDEQGFTFFGNYQSAKGQELAANPYAAMTFFWPGLERQVRIEGPVARLDPQLSDAYFDSRPKPAAWAPGRRRKAGRWPTATRCRQCSRRPFAASSNNPCAAPSTGAATA